jgi:hypothetical protein
MKQDRNYDTPLGILPPHAPPLPSYAGTVIACLSVEVKHSRRPHPRSPIGQVGDKAPKNKPSPGSEVALGRMVGFRSRPTGLWTYRNNISIELLLRGRGTLLPLGAGKRGCKQQWSCARGPP